jgi:hypothetical protein
MQLKNAICDKGMGKELPIFSGDAHDWPARFIIYRSIAACGFSQDENMLACKDV